MTAATQRGKNANPAPAVSPPEPSSPPEHQGYESPWGGAAGREGANLGRGEMVECGPRQRGAPWMSADAWLPLAPGRERGNCLGPFSRIYL